MMIDISSICPHPLALSRPPSPRGREERQKYTLKLPPAQGEEVFDILAGFAPAHFALAGGALGEDDRIFDDLTAVFAFNHQFKTDFIADRIDLGLLDDLFVEHEETGGQVVDRGEQFP